MKASFSYLLFSLLLLLTVSCEQIAEIAGDATADTPEVTYSKTTLEADFYTAGSSSAPSIDWNGDQGSFSLGSTIEGLSINSTTGKLEWTKLLPPGNREVDVVVANSEGQVVVPITIQNPLAGSFKGTYAGSFDYSMTFSKDGSLTVFADGTSATGTYEIRDGEFTAYYVYDEYPDDDYSLRGEVQQTGTSATIIGNYYSGVYSAGDSPVNGFEVTLE